MRNVAVLGISMTKFGKFLDRSLKDLGREAVSNALADVGISKEQIQAAYVGNTAGGIVTGQHCIRGQVILRAMGIGDIPIMNIENACATGCATFYMAWMDVASGLHDCVLALGLDKVYHSDKKVSYEAVNAVRDIELSSASEQIGDALLGHAERARNYMAAYGLTREQLAMVSSKNHYNGSLNPYAQYQKPMTVDEILGFRVVADPITVPMCSPLGDGAAAVIVCSADYAKRYTTRPVFVATSVFRTGKDIGPDEPILTVRTSKEAYEKAGIGPSEIDVFEVNNAVTFLEIEAYESLGICGRGESPSLIESKTTELTGRHAVNPSGGLESRGHPFGATGLAQIVELVWQLRGQAGQRQVERPPKSGLAEMNGGRGDPDESAAEGITILKS